MGVKKQSKNLPPPWMKGARRINGVPVIMVHTSEPELKALDDLQGGPSIDPDTDVREYSRLDKIIEIPEIRELFHTVFDQLKKTGHVSPELQESYKIAKRNSFPYHETAGEESGPLDELDDTGRFGDTKFAWFPESFIVMLIESGHKISQNPTTGLLEFGFFDEVLRVVGTVGGALLGGPIGAGLGNAAARAATGSKFGNALVGGLKTGALAYGAQGLGQAAGLSAATPYTGGFFGGAPNMIASGLGSMGIGKAVAPAASKAISAASVGIPVGVAAANAAPVVATPAVQQAVSSGFMDNLAKIAPWGMMGLSYLNDKQAHKFHEKQAREERERYEKEKAQLGYSPNWQPVMSKKHVENPEFYKVSRQDLKHGIFPSPFVESPTQRYAKGGTVRSLIKTELINVPGKGNGQDDDIKDSVPNGSYIIDASSTSGLGDGSSRAGGKVLDKFVKQIIDRAPKRLIQAASRQVSKNNHNVPIYISNDEVKIPPIPVTVLGRGSNKEGADILRHMVNNLRKHKASNGSSLPPKAKDPWEYIKQRRV